MVAMLILMIIMLAILSLLISAFRAVAENSTHATAAELAQQRLELARTQAVAGSCANLETVVEPAVTTTDGRGVPLTVTATVKDGKNPANDCVQVGDVKLDPKLTLVTVTVTTTDPNFTNPIVETSSNIYVRFEE